MIRFVAHDGAVGPLGEGFPPDGFKQLAQERPAVMEFMKNEVKPKMAAMLGEPEWTPETKSGFGCGECHTTAQ